MAILILIVALVIAWLVTGFIGIAFVLLLYFFIFIKNKKSNKDFINSSEEYDIHSLINSPRFSETIIPKPLTSLNLNISFDYLDSKNQKSRKYVNIYNINTNKYGNYYARGNYLNDKSKGYKTFLIERMSFKAQGRQSKILLNLLTIQSQKKAFKFVLRPHYCWDIEGPQTTAAKE